MATSAMALLQEATQLHRQGRLPEAERLYRSVLGKQPRNLDALRQLVQLKVQGGQPVEAADLLLVALRENPNSADLHTLLASIMLALGRADEAIVQLDRVVALQPNNADAHFNHAAALAQAGRLAEALAGYDRVIAVAPGQAEPWFNRGNVLAQLGRNDDAVASYDRALALAPNSLNTLNNRGNALAALGRHEEALGSFERAHAIAPGDFHVLSNSANSLNALRRHAEALTNCERALAISPNAVKALVARGNTLHAMKQHERAIESYERALATAPDDVEILSNKEISLLETGRFKEALETAERAIAVGQGNPLAYHGRAKALQALARYDEALLDYQKALQINPDLLDAKWNSSLCLLWLGRFEEGWSLYENRWSEDVAITKRPYTAPRWNGEPVAGVLLAWGEQGVGDQVLFASVIPEVVQQAGKLLLEVDERLVPLFARSFPEPEIIPLRPALYSGRIDAQVSLGSLPRHLRRSWAAFPPRPHGYLVPDAGRIRQLRDRLTADKRQAIGLSWVSRNLTIGRYKSAQLKDFAALLQLPNLRFIDLQYGDTTAEREAVQREFGISVERPDDIDTMNDLDGLAALIAACDAVVTVSNTTAHLAGAVGTPTWVMVPYGRGHLWYWFVNRPQSPWYPRVEVRRQQPDKSWPDLITSITPEIAAALANSSARAGSVKRA